jgi:hypothetical protein
MNIIETIQDLKTIPRRQEEEYEYTSDFIEWFYHNIYRGEGFMINPILQEISNDPEYQCIQEQCKNLININYTKTLENEQIISLNEDIKKWLINTINKYNN